MTECVLTVIDTMGIQPYIFGSNRLQENIGASELVESATGRWVFELLNDGLRTNVDKNGPIEKEEDKLTLESGQLDAELLYAGGGNTFILFRSEELARNWTQRLSRQVLRDAPGLQIAVAHSEPFVWDENAADDLRTRIKQLIDGPLARAKQQRQASAPLLGLGVTADCQSTGMPAVKYDDDRWMSREVVCKLSAVEQANERFRDSFQDFKRLDMELSNDFDDLGRSRGERSYIAVVHADGNGMGERFIKIGQGLANRAYIKSVRDLSKQVQQAGMQALVRAVGDLFVPDSPVWKRLGISKHNGLARLPFRPLVYGGDDVTFVCDGRIGMPLAASYLQAFEQETQNLPEGRATACAGIAIVKTHYPFARAYALSEELCKNAKKFAHERDASALDWHIAMSGLLSKLRDIREREYIVRDGSLTLRPVWLSTPQNRDQSWRNWQDVAATISAFQNEEAWADKRNKVKQLREVLREGSEKTKQFLNLYQMNALPGYDNASNNLRETGWEGDCCGYFDPIEAIDFYLPLGERS